MLHTLQLPVRDLSAVLICAAKGDIRQYLNSVFVESRAGAVTLVATDGHRLIAARVPGSPENDFSFIVSRDAVEAWIKGAKKISDITVDYDDETGDITGHLPNGKTVSQQCDGTYPDWRRVIPRKVSGKTAQYQARYLGDFQKIADIYAPRRASMGDGFIAVGYNGNDTAVVTIPDAPHILALVMPLRVCNLTAPEWANVQFANAEKAEQSVAA